MGSKKISQLTGNTNPSLSGVTIFDDGTTTYKTTLNTLRNKLVESGSHFFTGSQYVNGNLVVTGSIIAQDYIMSSSVIYQNTLAQSGSTIFGNTLDDTHQITGSLLITGSLIINNTSFSAASSGTSGTSGISGTSGTSGTSGSSGSSGSSGTSGISGDHGDNGSSGTSGTSGSSGTSSVVVSVLADYINLGDLNVYDTVYLSSVIDVAIGTIVIVSYNPSNYFLGQVVQLNPLGPNTIRIDVLKIVGSASGNGPWNLGIAGQDGTSGSSGSSGTSGSSGSSGTSGTSGSSGTSPVVTGSTNHVAYFNTNDTLGYLQNFHALNGANGGQNTFGIGTQAYTPYEPERLIVDGGGSYNIATFQTSRQDYYAEVNIKNFGSGSNASVDLVIWNDSTTENSSYLDLGMNSSDYTAGYVGYENDSYLFTTANDLYIGSTSTGASGHLHLFAGDLWNSSSISLYQDGTIGFGTDWSDNSATTIPSSTSGFTYEFSGSIKLRNELSVDGSVTASFFVGDGSLLTNLPAGLNGTSGTSGTDGSSGTSGISPSLSPYDGNVTINGDLTITGETSFSGVIENVTVDGGFSGNRDFDFTSGSIFHITGLTGNGTWNVNNIPTDNNKATTITFVISQDATPYSGSQYQINSSNVTVKWVDNTIPTGNANNIDVIGLTVFRVDSSWEVLGGLSTFGV